MTDKYEMPRVEFDDEKLKASKIYKKYVEDKNFQRAELAKPFISRKRGLLAGSISIVLGIYAYTIFRIKQETFLDDFEEPVRVVKS